MGDLLFFTTFRVASSVQRFWIVLLNLVLAALVLGLLCVALLWLPVELTRLAFDGQKGTPTAVAWATRVSDERRAVLWTLGGILAVLSLIYTARRHTLDRDANRTDRYASAIEQLGSEKLAIRLGGLYALERLAFDSSRDRSTIAEVFAAFIRSYEPVTNGVVNSKIDVIAALTIVTRNKLSGASPVHVDLTGADLAGLDLRDVELPGADFSGANLAGADLRGAVLSKADLRGTILTRARLTGADFEGADMSRADLENVDAAGSDFTGADLSGANLRGSNLTEASLRRAVLLNAELVGATLSNTEVAGAQFLGARLTVSSLDSALLDGIVIDSATASGLLRTARVVPKQRG